MQEAPQSFLGQQECGIRCSLLCLMLGWEPPHAVGLYAEGLLQKMWLGHQSERGFGSECAPYVANLGHELSNFYHRFGFALVFPLVVSWLPVDHIDYLPWFAKDLWGAWPSLGVVGRTRKYLLRRPVHTIGLIY